MVVVLVVGQNGCTGTYWLYAAQTGYDAMNILPLCLLAGSYLYLYNIIRISRLSGSVTRFFCIFFMNRTHLYAHNQAKMIFVEISAK